MAINLHAVMARHLALSEPSWSLGAFGAIAEFMRRDDEPCETGELSCATARGAIRVALPLEAQLVHYKTPSRHPARRRTDIALCLPHETCAGAVRTVVTEVGPDWDALRESERDHILFDIGLGRLQVDCLVRTGDPETLDLLRAAEGRSLFDPDVTLMREIPRLSPHRVFVSRCGRIEVYQSVPAPDGRSPDGPHTHVLPKLLASGRTHAANLDIPEGLVPCLTIHLSRPDADHATRDAQEGA